MNKERPRGRTVESNPNVSRREILRLGLGAAGVLGIGALALAGLNHNKPPVNQIPSPTQPIHTETMISGDPLVDALRPYKDSYLPPETVTLFAENLLQQQHYPLFTQTGHLILENQQSPDNLTKLSRNLAQDKPIGLNFTHLGSTVAKLENKQRFMVTEEIRLSEKTTGISTYLTGLEIQQNNIQITLNSRLFDAGASSEVFRLMLAKEASHLPLYPKAKEVMLQEMRTMYDIPTHPLLEDQLMLLALMAKDPEFRAETKSPTFYHLSTLLDYAGYYAITPTLLQLAVEGKLTAKDQGILAINAEAAQKVYDQGLIQQVPNSTAFEWTNGMDPFGIEWRQVMDQVLEQNTFVVPAS